MKEVLLLLGGLVGLGGVAKRCEYRDRLNFGRGSGGDDESTDENLTHVTFCHVTVENKYDNDAPVSFNT